MSEQPFPTKGDEPAFPGKIMSQTLAGEVAQFQWCGLSKRDWLAAMAMHGFCANQKVWQMTPDLVSECAYAQADAMLKQSEVGR